MPATIQSPEHVIFFSGGVCSFLAAHRVLQSVSSKRCLLLFCDTHVEDEDCYRFIAEAAQFLNCRLQIISDGRTPWQVFRHERIIGNNFADPCSRHLKRRLARRWLNEHCDPAHTTLYLGLAWYERHRIDKNQRAWHPWTTNYPMVADPLLDHCEMLAAVKAVGLTPPRLYELGFNHNNCGGACVKAGKANWRLLLEKLPWRYAGHEEEERNLREYLQADVSILTTLVDGEKRPYTLEEFRYHCKAYPMEARDEDWGGCACMLDPEEDELTPQT